eukprot:6078063-Amphidinium_carterae.1
MEKRRCYRGCLECEWRAICGVGETSETDKKLGTVLGLFGALPNREEVRVAFKRRALETHPDKGGSVEEF